MICDTFIIELWLNDKLYTRSFAFIPTSELRILSIIACIILNSNISDFFYAVYEISWNIVNKYINAACYLFSEQFYVFKVYNSSKSAI